VAIVEKRAKSLPAKGFFLNISLKKESQEQWRGQTHC
jgi:hypothetical protein